MSPTRCTPRAVLLSWVLPLLVSSCSPDDLADPEPDALAQQAAIDGSVRITPTVDAGRTAPPRDAGAPSEDAGTDDPAQVPAGETVTLPDGGIIYLDPACPGRETLFGSKSVGCCRFRKCGLSNHTLDFPGVSRECQSYDQVKELDSDFTLETKACKLGPAP